MSIVQILGIAFVGVFIILLLRQYRPEYVIYVSILIGVIIFGSVALKIGSIIEMLESLSSKIGIDAKFFSILVKITGIAYLTEFGVNICRDSGETAVASKVEIAGKVIIITLSIPIIATLIETISKVM